MVLSKDVKIAICFGFIIGVIISFCNLCFGAEPVEVIVLNDTQFIPLSGNTTASITSSSSRSLYYFPIESGYTYKVKNLGGAKYFGFSDSEPSVGTVVYDIETLNSQATISFTRSTSGYLFFSTTINNGTSAISVTREPLVGMSGTIDNLAYVLSLNNVWQIVGFVVPILAIAILLVLGFYLINKLINKIKRKKGGA